VGGDGQRPNTVYMLNTKDGTILHTARDHTRLVYQIECTKDYVVTLGFDFVIVRNHKLEKIRSFSRDDHISSTIMENDILAVNHGEKNIGLFDLNTGEQLSKHDVIVSRIAYCGVPGMLVIGRNDGSMAFYNVSTKRIQELPRTNFSGAVRAIKVV
jgi:WD40 repeat protein